MQKRINVEVCAYNIAACRAAMAAGAARIELCAGYAAGGTTPARTLINAVKKEVTIPVFPIIRPRRGNFTYIAAEADRMLEDIAWCRQAGCGGISTGALLPDGKIDVALMKQFIDQAGHMEVTCHKAFDETPNQEEAMEALIAAGCARILTSGGMACAEDGATRLGQLVRAAAGRISIMAGGGIRQGNVASVLKNAHVDEVHTSAITAKAYNRINKSELYSIVNIISSLD